MKYLFFNLLVLLSCNRGLGQFKDPILAHTQSVVDTSSSKLQQAKDIYYWISNNVKYDVKALRKHQYKNQHPEELLKTRKGICGEISDLFTSMCRSIDIEAFTIYGYSKGYEYHKNQIFLRSNHAWNTLLLGDSIIHSDATWGIGYLYKGQSVFSKLGQIILGKPVRLTKLKFMPSPSMAYFNISTDSLLMNHYPSDPNWLGLNHPISYHNFVSEEDSSDLFNLDYQRRITTIRGLSEYDQRLSEGEIAKIYNPLNTFNLASANHNKAFSLIPGDELPESKQSLEAIQEFFDSALANITAHQLRLDSVYQSRKNEFKNLSKSSSKVASRLESQNKSVKKKHAKNRKKTAKTYKSLEAKSDRYIEKKQKSKEKDLKIASLTASESKRKELIQDTKSKLSGFDMEHSYSLLYLDSLKNNCKKLLDSVSGTNDNYLTFAGSLGEDIYKLSCSFGVQNEDRIKANTSSMLWSYQLYQTSQLQNKQLKARIGENKKSFESKFKEMEKGIQQAYKDVALLFPTNKEELELADNLFDHLKKLHAELYDLNVEYYKSLVVHNSLQEEYNNNLHATSKKLRKTAKALNKQSQKWYENKLALETEEYQSEKQIAKAINSESGKFIGKIEKLLVEE